ncbi:MAG: metallophosphoesterase [Elusimicrobia bacterium]|nr:metallophosphoesterase [Elusimicrobiota bacterium]
MRPSGADIIDKVERVLGVMAAEERPGGIKDRIRHIGSDHLIQEGGVAYLPAQAGSRLIVVGDLHGDVSSLRAILKDGAERSLREGKASLVAIGDYIWGGERTIELLLELMDLKLRYPQQVLLLRGNHDERQKTPGAEMLKYMEMAAAKGRRVCFFPWLVREKGYGPRVYDAFARLLERLPTVAVTGNGIVLAHASPPADRVDSLRQLVGDARSQSKMRLNQFYEVKRHKDPIAPERGSLHPFIDIVAPRAFHAFLEAVGGSVFVAGHHHGAPSLPDAFNARLGVVISFGGDSQDGLPDHGWLRPRYAVLSLDRPVKRLTARMFRSLRREL